MKKKRTLKHVVATLLLICVTLGASVAAYSQSARITLDLKDKPLESLFKELGKQSKMVFLFDDQLIKSKGNITLKVTNRELESLLKEFLTPLGLAFTKEDNVYVIRELPNQKKMSLSRLISGVVVDDNNEPMPGVNIIIKGTQKGVATGLNGEFNLNVDEKPGLTLTLSCIGYEQQELKLTESLDYKIKLVPKAEFLADAMVTGYQTLSRERSAGSFSKIAGEDISQRVNLTNNILESFEGLTTGLSVNYGVGEDKYLIRGTTSINSTTAPLLVVDGVIIEESSINDLINGNDIDNVTFLKDATATSIWGARAANGVIVISTKAGKVGVQKTKISYNGNYTFKGLQDFNYRNYMSTEQFIQSAKEIFDPVAYPYATITGWSGGSLVYPHEIPLYDYHSGAISEAERDKRLAELASRNNRSQMEKYLMQPALFTKHALSFTGGTKNYSFYGSVSYDYNQSNELSNTNKFNLNLRQNINLASWLSIDLTTNLSLGNTESGVMPGQIQSADVYFPYAMLADEQGNPLDHSNLSFIKSYQNELESGSGLDLSFNPLLDMKEGFNNSKSFNGRVNLGVNATLAKGLKFEGKYQYQQDFLKEEKFLSQYHSTVRYELAKFTTPANPPTTTGPTYYLPKTGGRYTLTNNDGTSWTVRNQLSFDRSFNERKSQINVIAGMEIQAALSSSHSNTRRGYDPQTMTYQQYDEKELATNGVSGAVWRSFGVPRNTLTSKIFTQGEVERRFVSFYSNFAYTYLNKYTFNGGVRVDQSNLFGSDPSVQFRPVWSVGGLWNIKKEEFMEGYSIFNRLNLRFSYGYGGNSPTSGMGGPYNLLLANTNPNFSSLGTGFNIIYPANDKIKWERTRTINLGLDVAILRNRISTTLDIYHKLTTDLLTEVPSDQTLGWASYYANLGDMKNQGFEFSINSTNISSSKFQWVTTLNLTHNTNKVLRLNDQDKLTASRKIYFDYTQGYPGNSLFAYQWAGLSNQGNPQIYSADREIIVNSSDPKLTPEAVNFMGVTQPKWYGGVTNTFSYKGFDLSFLIVYNFGHKMRRDINNFWYGRLNNNKSAQFMDRWKKPGDEEFTNIPKYVSRLVDNQTSTRTLSFYEFSDINILNASYIKLRDLTVRYNLPKSLCDKISAEKIAINAQASNLFLLAANKEGIDPEAFHYRSGLRTTRYGTSWSIGLIVNFK